jgi:hypothetical protein
VVGGYAVNFHGLVRNTQALDLLIRPMPGNAENLARALVDLGFSGFSPEQLIDPKQAGQRAPPGSCRRNAPSTEIAVL